ncbi:DUF7519 family protein [Haloarcula halophila]|uniref:DUF7519 family protein n=1 Tax=Haloarcula TaxID=2237 RepID=UPI0023E3AE43|nr:hypothetical protein [Halomicroarcula sp. DFY41]
MSGIDTRPVRSTATLAGVLAVLTALAVGLSIGDPLPVVSAVGGAVLLAGGTWALGEESNARVAAGSVMAVAGIVGFALTVVFAAGGSRLAAFLGLAIGTMYVLLDAVTDSADDGNQLGAALRESGNALLVGIVVAVLLSVTAQYNVLSGVVFGVSGLAAITPLVGFVTLQIGAVLVLLLLNRVVPVLEGWLPDPGSGDRTLDTLSEVGMSRTEVPVTVWAVLGVEGVVALFPQAQVLFNAFLAGTPVVGSLLRVALSGLVHVPLVVLAVGLLGILLASGLQRWVVDWLGDDPARTLSLQSGGIVAVVATILGTTAVSLLGIDLFGRSTAVSTLIGPAAVVLGGLVTAVLLIGLVVAVVPLLSHRGFLPQPAGGFALGSAVLFLTILLGAELGVPTVLVIAGSAATLLIWDAGAHASSIGLQLGRDAGTSDSEFVHVTGTGLVLGLAVVGAIAARYLVVPAIAPRQTSAAALRSVIALFLIVLAILALGLALSVRSDSPVAE